MKIQYMSDLHMEFQENSRYLKNNELPVTGDVLVLAGDIFYLKDKYSSLYWECLLLDLGGCYSCFCVLN